MPSASCSGRARRGSARAMLVLRARRVRLQHDAGEDFLPVFRIGNADRRRLEHRRMPQQRFVDLARRDVLAALDDQLLQPAGDEVEAVGVAIAEVAGREPAAGTQRAPRSLPRRRGSAASRWRRGARSRRVRRRARIAPSAATTRASIPSGSPGEPILRARAGRAGWRRRPTRTRSVPSLRAPRCRSAPRTRDAGPAAAAPTPSARSGSTDTPPPAPASDRRR